MLKYDNKDIGFIYKNGQVIDKIYARKNAIDYLLFEQGFLREQIGARAVTTEYRTVGKNLKNYRIYGNNEPDSLNGYQFLNYIQQNQSQGLTTITINTSNLSIKKIVCAFEYSGFSGSHPMIFSALDNNGWVCTDGTVSGDWTITPTKDYSESIQTVEFTATYTGNSTISSIRTGWTDTVWTPTGKYYYIKIYDSSDNLIAYLKPSRKLSDNTLGFYDVIRNTFYTKSTTTGALVAGSDLVDYVGDKTSNRFYASEKSELEGLTVIYNPADYTYTINGTVTNKNIWISNTVKPNIIEGTKVKLKYELLSGSLENSSHLHYSMFNAHNDYIRVSDSTLVTPGIAEEIAPMVSGATMRFCIQCLSGECKFNNAVYRVSLEELSEASPTFEPFGYKIPIESKNIINIDDFTENVVSELYKDTLVCKPRFKLKPDTQYTLTFNYEFETIDAAAAKVEIGYGTNSYNIGLADTSYTSLIYGTKTINFRTPYKFDSSYTPNLVIRFVRCDSAQSWAVNISNVKLTENTAIYLSSPLAITNSDYPDFIDFSTQKLNKYNGSAYVATDANLPTIPTGKNKHTTIKLETKVIPSSFEITYRSYIDAIGPVDSNILEVNNNLTEEIFDI